jgi:hypothetical protein
MGVIGFSAAHPDAVGVVFLVLVVAGFARAMFKGV